MKGSGVIYCIECENGKRYVGSTTDIATRKKNHFSTLKINKHFNSLLQEDFNRLGEQAFRVYILGGYEINNLIDMERLWIKKLKSDDHSTGYNLLSPTKDNTHFIWARSSREKLSSSLRKRPPFTEQHRRHLSEANKGKLTPLKQAQIARLAKKRKGLKLWGPQDIERLSKDNSGQGNPFFGRTHSAKTKALISAARKGKKYWCRNPIERSRKISQALRVVTEPKQKIFSLTSPSGEVITFKGIREFCRTRGLHRWPIKCLIDNNGKRKQYLGWKPAPFQQLAPAA